MMNWKGQLVRWVVKDGQYTDFDTFLDFESELIQYQRKMGYEVGLPAAWQTLCHKYVEK